MRRISVDQVLFIHKYLIEVSGGVDGIRDSLWLMVCGVLRRFLLGFPSIYEKYADMALFCVLKLSYVA
ncbi:MAG: hypothetical protein M0R06_22735 [Sphaerochaeta sp.]|jgi:hypothetical protein|nr:hypothetical protein [Sphaerochaeta sp.]